MEKAEEERGVEMMKSAVIKLPQAIEAGEQGIMVRLIFENYVMVPRRSAGVDWLLVCCSRS